MLCNEARWISHQLKTYPIDRLSPLINLGSSTSYFRERGQPFISELIFEPLVKRGVEVVHTDIEEGEGVDIVGDILDPAVFAKLKSLNPGALICANILEHVEDPEKLAKVCVDIVRDNGLILATVPYSFPLHLAPIDTMFRPTVEELASLFPQCRVNMKDVVDCGTLGQQILGSPKVLLKHLIRMLVPWPTLTHWKAAMHRNNWLFRNYRISCVAMEKIDPV